MISSKITKILIGFIVTFFATTLLSPFFEFMDMPVAETGLIKLAASFFLPFILILISFYISYRMRVLEYALAGYSIPVLCAGYNYVKKCSMVQTEGLIFIFLLIPGVLVYTIMKIIQELKAK
jgi:hypothetical protein